LPVQFKRRETILRRPNAINSTNEANGYVEVVPSRAVNGARTKRKGGVG
jgi:hypothetical protein